MRVVVGISDWPESAGERFDILEVKPDESDDEAMQRARAFYSPKLTVEVEVRSCT